MHISGLQTSGTPGDVSANLAELDAAAAAARESGSELLITPEMFLTGYDIGERLITLAATDMLSEVKAIARRNGIALIVGAPEQTDDGIYNSAFFVDEAGEVLGTHRKCHLFGDLDRELFVAGSDPFTMVGYRGIDVAMMICYDVEFPESVRAAALAGAHLVAVPTAQMTPYAFIAEAVVRTRAWENQVYLAYINHDGVEGSLTYVGRSSIISPDATVLAWIEHGDGLIHATVDPAYVADQQVLNPYLSDRRPDSYDQRPHDVRRQQ